MELPKKITNYIDGLDDAAQDRLMTRRLIPGGIASPPTGGGDVTVGCLMQVAENDAFAAVGYGFSTGVWRIFDQLCRPADNTIRDAEVGAAIRDYITELRARRLTGLPAVGRSRQWLTL